MTPIKTQNIPLENLSLLLEKQQQKTAMSGEEFSEILDFSCNKQADKSKESKETKEKSEEPENIECNEGLKVPWLFWRPPQEMKNNSSFESEGEVLAKAAAVQVESDDPYLSEILSMLSETENLLEVQGKESILPADFVEEQALDLTHTGFLDLPIAEDLIDKMPNSTEHVNPEKQSEEQVTEVFNSSKATKEQHKTADYLVFAKSTNGESVKRQEHVKKEPLNSFPSQFTISEPVENVAQALLSETETEITPTGSFSKHLQHTSSEPVGISPDETDFSLSLSEKRQTKFSQGEEPLKYFGQSEVSTDLQAFNQIPKATWGNEVESFIVEQTKLLDETNVLERVSTAKIQLSPKHLGELEIEVSLQKNKLTAKLLVEQAETKEWLEHKMAELKIKLASQNIEVVDFHVAIAKSDPALAYTESHGHPFFDKQKQEENKRKPKVYSSKTEDETKKNTSQNIQNNGHLSLWV